jgi:ABC-type transporter Mla subunit MlaD
MVERSNPLEAIAPTGAELAGKMNRIEPDHFEQFNDQLQNAQNALQQAKDNLATSDVELNDRQSAQLNQLMENFYQG